jgi:nonsense-mediated mRNA decay protein 3
MPATIYGPEDDSSLVTRIHIANMSMDLDEPISLAPATGLLQNAATILCCNCGAPIDGTTAAGALCYDCVKLTVDISKGVQREATLNFCRDCDRWLSPPQSWVTAAMESRELLALCLKKLKGLHKVRIIDASFVWTEPHSRRVRVKITVQDSIQDGVLLQQTFEVVYIVAYQQCPDCAKSYTANVWRANAQVRQKVPHKRTFLYLEQMILKSNAHRDTINIKEARNGIDFYFAHRNQAEAFVNFLESVVPCKTKKSQELISQDVHTSSKSYKFTFSVELIPICKEDLVALPLKLAKQIGNISPLVLAHRVGTSIYVLDPNTLQTADVTSPIYWRNPFSSLMDSKDLTEFIVMDIEASDTRNGKWQLAEATVARAADLGVNDNTYFVRTHLGHLLKPGDSVLGYMLTGTNLNSPHFDAIEESHAYGSTIPDVVLVKKFWPRKQKHSRHWKLKRMAKDEGELLPAKQEQQKMDAEYENFLRDIEEDDELRAALALYKNSNKGKRVQDPDAMSVAATEITSGGDDRPAIDMTNLLDDMEELHIEDEA